VNIVSQSKEISRGVDINGAGDQGICVGYACSDNEDMIPDELYYSRSLCKFIYDQYPYDGKTQVTIDKDRIITDVVVSFQNVSSDILFSNVKYWIESLPITTEGVNILTNPAGDWNIGGFEADTGLTGRKLMVDNYGPQIPVGGGCFSGKDATKIDRSGAYMARKIAVEIVKRKGNHNNWALVKIAYAIGVAEPVMVSIETDSGKWSEIDVEKWISEYNYDLTPKGIIETLKLREPQFEETARWGHFGCGFTWDK
jgi:S-adenosylmethionine synthetase